MNLHQPALECVRLAKSFCDVEPGHPLACFPNQNQSAPETLAAYV